ncbi:MAG: efflux RND transporter periplasmic adaptor subunit [Reyranellaceae bacterium]
MAKARKGNRVVIYVALLLLAAVAAGAWWYSNGGAMMPASRPSGQSTTTLPRPAASPPASAIPVEAIKVTVETAQRQTLAIGTFRSFESVIIRPEVTGRVSELPFREGEKVARGQVMVRLDASVEQATLAQAEARLALAKANFARAQTLLARDAGTVKALDEARTGLLSAEADITLAKARLEKMSIAAPFDGIAGLRRVSVGDYLSPGTNIVNLEQIDPLKIDFRVPEIFLPAVKDGAAISVTVDAFPGRSFTGAIYAIDPLIDQAGRSIVVRARIDNPGDILRPGLFARVALTLAVRENAIFVPEQSIIPIGDKSFVYRVIDGKIANTPVRLGLRRSASVEVLEGLSPGDLVVTAGQLKVQHGRAVTVVPAPGDVPIAPRVSGDGAPPSPAQPAGERTN